MREEIVNRWKAACNTHGLDAMVSCSPENFAYLTGFVVPSQPLMRHRHAMGIVTADGQTAILGVDMEATTIGRREPGTTTRIWAEFSDNAMAVCAELLTEMGLARARIGIELDYLPASEFEKLRAALPGATFVSNQQIVARLRQIKTADEIALLRRLSRIADQSITDALRAVQAGDTEMDLAGHLTRNVYSLGAEQFKLLIVATGERSQLPNVGPSLRKLESGDVCRVEIFSVISGYQAGVCRTAVVQKAPPHAERIWKTASTTCSSGSNRARAAAKFTSVSSVSSMNSSFRPFRSSVTASDSSSMKTRIWARHPRSVARAMRSLRRAWCWALNRSAIRPGMAMACT